VCKAIKATNQEGETAAYAFVEGKHALLSYAPSSPGSKSHPPATHSSGPAYPVRSQPRGSVVVRMQISSRTALRLRWPGTQLASSALGILRSVVA